MLTTRSDPTHLGMKDKALEISDTLASISYQVWSWKRVDGRMGKGGGSEVGGYVIFDRFWT